MANPRIDDCVERLCNKGCRSVRSDIERLERGEQLFELSGLSNDEGRLVLAELKMIMTVYGDTCRAL